MSNEKLDRIMNESIQRKLKLPQKEIADNLLNNIGNLQFNLMFLVAPYILYGFLNLKYAKPGDNWQIDIKGLRDILSCPKDIDDEYFLSKIFRPALKKLGDFGFGYIKDDVTVYILLTTKSVNHKYGNLT